MHATVAGHAVITSPAWPIVKPYVRTIWNGIDASRFAFRGPKDSPTAISVARLSPEKDMVTLLRATRQVAARMPEFRL